MNENKNKTILFVEDDLNLLKLVTESLEDAGYKVIKALNGEDCIEILKDIKPDLILLDLILPKKDGFDVLSETSKDQMTKNIPIIVLTNLEEKFDIERALSYGVRAYLVKTNYGPSEIVKKVGEILK
ncbi:MAG: response regulator [Patescibacteria group bacterium]